MHSRRRFLSRSSPACCTPARVFAFRRAAITAGWFRRDLAQDFGPLNLGHLVQFCRKLENFFQASSLARLLLVLTALAGNVDLSHFPVRYHPFPGGQHSLCSLRV